MHESGIQNEEKRRAQYELFHPTPDLDFLQTTDPDAQVLLPSLRDRILEGFPQTWHGYKLDSEDDSPSRFFVDDEEMPAFFAKIRNIKGASSFREAVMKNYVMEKKLHSVINEMSLGLTVNNLLLTPEG